MSVFHAMTDTRIPTRQAPARSGLRRHRPIVLPVARDCAFGRSFYGLETAVEKQASLVGP